ncbi:MAG TPA: GH92 family glycosyl hydrolase [Thermoleophilaceae bacterium]|nr:GH92 family glycosyl hydrolase [Thermoleophilaceae bacterium]
MTRTKTLSRASSALTGALLALALSAGAATAAPAPDLARHVDPIVGTSAPGFVFPGAVVPFGMVQNSPDTHGTPFAYGGYLYEEPMIRGFSLVHISGPGVPKAGDLPFMPTVGMPPSGGGVEGYASEYSHATEIAEPGYYSVMLTRYATRVELTASAHAAMQRYTFPPSPRANVIADVTRGVDGTRDGKFEVTGSNELSGFTRGRYPVYFVARFSRPFASHDGRSVSFDTLADGKVTMRVGISFVDLKGARRNLQAEAPDYDFDRMRHRARESWNRTLSKVRVSGGTADELKTFYTALYHAQLHPNVFTDVDGRYLGVDGRPHVARGRVQYANFSLWDTYKGENQLLAVLQPRRYRDMLLSMYDFRRLGSKMPRWGEQNLDANHMSGDPAIPMIVDGYCRGIVGRDGARKLYGASRDLLSRRDRELDKPGYLPENAGTTLEYGVADFALGLMAHGMGRRTDARRLVHDSLRYRKLLDPETRWIRPRNADGSWQSPYDPVKQKGFQEGNAWQYSWLDTHDAHGLFNRMGGADVVVGRLDHMFSQPPEMQVAQSAFGTRYDYDQYAPGNEHDLEVPWIYPFAKRPWRTAAVTRRLRTVFKPTHDGLPGNDDLGGLSGWYVWNALGLSPVTPGAPFYVIGSPVFDKASIAGRTIERSGSGQYVQGATLNGRVLKRPFVFDREWRKLRLRMADDAGAAWGRVRPPSVSDSSLKAFHCPD